jgi:hypothetical protein
MFIYTLFCGLAHLLGTDGEDEPNWKILLDEDGWLSEGDFWFGSDMVEEMVWSFFGINNVQDDIEGNGR